MVVVVVVYYILGHVIQINIFGYCFRRSRPRSAWQRKSKMWSQLRRTSAKGWKTAHFMILGALHQKGAFHRFLNIVGRWKTTLFTWPTTACGIIPCIWSTRCMLRKDRYYDPGENIMILVKIFNIVNNLSDGQDYPRERYQRCQCCFWRGEVDYKQEI